jgi:hypothetical protein
MAGECAQVATCKFHNIDMLKKLVATGLYENHKNRKYWLKFSLKLKWTVIGMTDLPVDITNKPVGNTDLSRPSYKNR